MRNFSQKLLAFGAAYLFIFGQTFANEGMWLPLYLKQLEGKMQQMGSRLTADDIYNVNKASIKDAIVSFGGFCTGEIVSNKGLVFTNHHCGYRSIAALSSTKDNWLKDGFWASSFDKELRAEGLSVRILVRMEDVTEKVKSADNKDTYIKELEAAATKEGVGYEGRVQPFFYGNEYYLLVYQVFKDIRLVGTPPENVGKFGGDTDNWMWPRHTGDFSVFRIYADANNNPAEYSPNNKPYTPKHSLPISIKGVKENDFSFIMGFPGRTQRYLTSDMIKKTVNVSYPTMAHILDQKLQVQKSFMDKDEAIKLQLAGSYASTANRWKYYLGNIHAAKNSDFISKKEAFETAFNQWAAADPARKEKYGNLVAEIKAATNTDPELNKVATYLNLAAFGSQYVWYARRYVKIGAEKELSDDSKRLLERFKNTLSDDFESYNASVDKAVFVALLDFYMKDISKQNWPTELTEGTYATLKIKGTKTRTQAYADLIYAQSIFTDKSRMEKWLANPSLNTLHADLGYKFLSSANNLASSINTQLDKADKALPALLETYMAAIREFKSGELFYPDANSTLRLTYGSIQPFNGLDGITYSHITTSKGILEKEIPGDLEFDVTPRMQEMIRNKDFGRYAENGELKVNFISSNDITGGNSGSPVINADGHLIGIAFDGNWDSMVGDLSYQEKNQRSISVDIRYVLWFMDKYANAQNLIAELDIRQ